MKKFLLIALFSLVVIPWLVSAQTGQTYTLLESLQDQLQTIVKEGAQVVMSPIIKYVQSPAEYKNILHPGERADLYGSNNTTQINGLDSSFKLKISGNSLDKTIDINLYLGRATFIVPIIPGGTYDLYLDNGEVASNKIQVTVVQKDSIIIPTVLNTPGAFGFDYVNGVRVDVNNLDSVQKEEVLSQLQSTLIQLIQQLIELLQQQAATAN